ncbi:caspase family protein [Spirosoma fluminis]
MKTLLLFTGFCLLTGVALAQPKPIATFQSPSTRLNTMPLFTTPTSAGSPVASRIDWTSNLGADQTVSAATFMAKACVTSAKPVARYTLFLNDKLQPSARDLKVERDTDCQQPFSQSVQLTEGENKIKLVAYLTGGGELTSSLEVTYRKPAVAETEKRLALIIGNSSYPATSRLTNPVNDAQDMAATLRELGFEVMLYTDLDKKKLRKAVDDFGYKLKDYQVGLFFYAGHGVAVGDHNYLVPIDAKPETAGDIEFDCEPADRVLAKMDDARTRTNIIVLDACRNNPFERSLVRGGNDGGLTSMNAPNGSYIAYATSPSKTAADGNGRNGLYTSALLKHLKVPNIPIEDVFKRVGREVTEQTGGRQRPWVSSSLTNDFYFRKK